MGTYTTLREAVDTYIKQNGNGEITGAILNDILNSMITSLGANYQVAGIATPATNPGSPEQGVVYFASEAGTYSNFGSPAPVLPLGIHLLQWNGTSWTATTWFTVDNAPTLNSNNFVKSGGIYNAVHAEAARAFASETARAEYDSTTKYVKFYNADNELLYSYNASAFVIDGMVQNVEIKDVTISGETVTCLVISFNTDAGKQDINIPLTQIFDPANYYTKTQIDNLLSAITSKLGRGALYVGLATPSTTPTADLGQKLFYIATQAGTYTNFLSNGDTPIVIAKDGIYILNGGVEADDWMLETVQEVDDVPTAGSENLVKSGGIYETFIEGRSSTKFLERNLPFTIYQGSIGIDGISNIDNTSRKATSFIYIGDSRLVRFYITQFALWNAGVVHVIWAFDANLQPVREYSLTNYVNANDVSKGFFSYLFDDDIYYIALTLTVTGEDVSAARITSFSELDYNESEIQLTVNDKVILNSGTRMTPNVDWKTVSLPVKTGDRIRMTVGSYTANSYFIFALFSDASMTDVISSKILSEKKMYSYIFNVSQDGILAISLRLNLFPSASYEIQKYKKQEIENSGNIENVELSLQKSIKKITSNDYAAFNDFTIGESYWVSRGNCSYSFIYIPDGVNAISIVANTNPAGIYLLKNNIFPFSSVTPSFATGITKRIVVTVGQAQIIELPNDCRYVAFMTKYDNTNITPDISLLYGFTGTFDARDFGVKYDGITDDTTAMQSAVDFCSNVSKILMVSGTVITSAPIILSSNSHIKLEHGAVIKLANGSNCPMFKNAKSDIAIDSPSAGTSYDQNITIEGGILDFNGDNQTFDNQVYTNSCGILLADVEHFTLRDITLKNPTTFGTHLNNIKWFTIENIFLDYNNTHGNMDGVHLNGGCCYGTIQNVWGTTNDDMIALNPGDVKFRYATIRIGAMHDIVVSNVKAVNGYRAIRLLSSVESPMYNIKISDVYGTYRYGAVSFSTYYDLIDGQRVSRDAIYKDIIINNINCKCGNTSIIWFDSDYDSLGSKIIASGIVINGVYYHYEVGNSVPFMVAGNLTQIDDMLITELNLTTDDVGISSVKLISGAGSINKLTMNNIYIDKPATHSGMQGIKITPSVLLISNAIIYLSSKYSATVLGESNVVYNGVLQV